MNARTIDVSPAVAQLAEWLEAQCERHAYGTFGVSLSLHKGEVRKVERHAIETLKPNDGGDYEPHKRPR